ncbi:MULTISPECIES: hypothetical protein, partial [unclassified Bradyrhizobium]|uniref:hypothetical protein n=1 Tax=unclassified Bradyrhizobium TaxID=2631580 RepID=UPI001A9E30CC
SRESHLARPINRHRIVIGNGAIRVTFADAAIRGVKFGRRLTVSQDNAEGGALWRRCPSLQ